MVENLENLNFYLYNQRNESNSEAEEFKPSPFQTEGSCVDGKTFSGQRGAILIFNKLYEGKNGYGDLVGVEKDQTKMLKLMKGYNIVSKLNFSFLLCNKI